MFFIDKIKTISAQFFSPQSVKHILPANIHSFTSFSSLSEASKLLSNHPTTCLLDPIISHLLQAISSAVVLALTHIINKPLHTGVFPSAFSQARLTPLLKKPTLNPSILENNRLVSLLRFIAKTLEWATNCSTTCSTKYLPFSHRTTSSTASSLVSDVYIQPRLPCSRLLKTSKSWFQIFKIIFNNLVGSVRCFRHS